MDTIKIDSFETKMIAHRGLSGIEKENTCPAFVAAGNRSYYGIETDVHVTKDGKIVVIHDDTTKRVTGGNIDLTVEEVNYSDLENIVLPDTDGSTNRQDIRIPLLKDYIGICKKYNKICVLEIKNHFAVSDLEKVINEVYNYNYLNSMIFISFDLDNCINLRKLLPNAKIQYLLAKDITDDVIDTLVLNNLDLDVQYTRLNKDIINKLHDKGILVNCWTCDDKEKAEELVSMGVDFITTNILE
ncbi:MAG: glycerophosphodiester phosphodiesterase [Clostridia bacterium]|nr:glycerophosphodiester phosphodiesterase [Clostridia bacterium]